MKYNFWFMVLLSSSFLLLMGETHGSERGGDSVVEQAQEQALSHFFDLLRDPERNINTLRNTLDKNPRYALMTDMRDGFSHGLTPAWTLIKAMGQKVGYDGLAEGMYGSETVALDLFFRQLLLDGAIVDFNQAEEMVGLTRDHVANSLVNTRSALYREMIWPRACEALRTCNSTMLTALIRSYPELLTEAVADPQTTLLHEAAKLVNDYDKRTYGMFKYLLEAGANYTLEDSRGQSIQYLMRLHEQEVVPDAIDAEARRIPLARDQLHPAALLFHSVTGDNIDRHFELPAVDHLKGLFSVSYTKAVAYKEYIAGAVVVCFVGYLLFGGSRPEELPMPTDMQVLG